MVLKTKKISNMILLLTANQSTDEAKGSKYTKFLVRDINNPEDKSFIKVN